MERGEAGGRAKVGVVLVVVVQEAEGEVGGPRRDHSLQQCITAQLATPPKIHGCLATEAAPPSPSSYKQAGVGVGMAGGQQNMHTRILQHTLTG